MLSWSQLNPEYISVQPKLFSSYLPNVLPQVKQLFVCLWKEIKHCVHFQMTEEDLAAQMEADRLLQATLRAQVRHIEEFISRMHCVDMKNLQSLLVVLMALSWNILFVSGLGLLGIINCNHQEKRLGGCWTNIMALPISSNFEFASPKSSNAVHFPLQDAPGPPNRGWLAVRTEDVGTGNCGIQRLFARNITVTNKQTAMGETLQIRDFGVKDDTFESEQLSI